MLGVVLGLRIVGGQNSVGQSTLLSGHAGHPLTRRATRPHAVSPKGDGIVLGQPVAPRTLGRSVDVIATAWGDSGTEFIVCRWFEVGVLAGSGRLLFAPSPGQLRTGTWFVITAK